MDHDQPALPPDSPLMTMTHSFLNDGMLLLSMPGHTRDGTYYILDGNTVLLVEKTLFKVSRYLLAHRTHGMSASYGTQLSSRGGAFRFDLCLALMCPTCYAALSYRCVRGSKVVSRRGPRRSAVTRDIVLPSPSITPGIAYPISVLALSIRAATGNPYGCDPAAFRLHVQASGGCCQAVSTPDSESPRVLFLLSHCVQRHLDERYYSWTAEGLITTCTGSSFRSYEGQVRLRDNVPALGRDRLRAFRLEHERRPGRRERRQSHPPPRRHGR